MQSNIELISLNELLLVPIYLVLIFIFSLVIRSYFIKKHKEYKYFIPGLIFKILGVSLFCLVYLFYYRGGDTVNYFFGIQAISNLIEQDFDKGLAVWLNTDSYHNSWISFNRATGFPPKYMWKDPNTFSVCRFSVPLYYLGAKSFLITSFFTACFSYIGIWKLYRLFNDLYPGNSRVFAYLILFLPTLIFWGGGIMKDSFVLGATCWITSNFYQIFIVRKKILLNSILIIFNALLIVNIKAYIIVSLIPGMLLWINSAYLKNIKSTITKILLFPLFIAFFVSSGVYISQNLSSFVGVYGDVNSAIEQAQVIQEDLLREDQYGGNNYNIGQVDGSLAGLFSVAPLAIFTSLYRPLFWEIGSPTMVFSVIENTILLFFSLILLFRTNPFTILRKLLHEPFLLYCFVFSILFAFGVGIAGTNFGALVRYKTPLVPFFFSMIYLVYKESRNKV